MAAMRMNRKGTQVVETRTAPEALVTWKAPHCPFLIEYTARTAEQLRLAAADAFFSLPRGGAEIGGVLLGAFEKGRLRILRHVPLDCEHAFGPSFTLSPKDHALLAELLAASRRSAGDAQPVGWYHSHTRSDVFLSVADLEIHDRYFPENWQVALVLRPYSLEHVQGGFFFRQADRSIQGAGPPQEFSADPAEPFPVEADAPPEPKAQAMAAAAVPAPITVLTPVEPSPPAPQPVAADPLLEIRVTPRETSAGSSRAYWLAALLAAAAIVAAIGYEARGRESAALANENAQLRQRDNDLRSEVSRLRSELERQTALNRKLQQDSEAEKQKRKRSQGFAFDPLL
ncbi:MAG: hypothetical protein C5B51_04450 [Terriglobia bacterium]|nr:MAG: hypothetical protein C5B51_04450 [Terriglobia bacterium]